MRRDLGRKPWFYPLPVLIIGTYDEDGVPDAMNAAYPGVHQSALQVFHAASERVNTSLGTK